mgnify:CR=1 FL=1
MRERNEAKKIHKGIQREGERVIRAKNAHLQVMQGGDGGIRRNIDSCDASLGVINLSGEKEVS